MPGIDTGAARPPALDRSRSVVARRRIDVVTGLQLREPSVGLFASHMLASRLIVFPGILSGLKKRLALLFAIEIFSMASRISQCAGRWRWPTNACIRVLMDSSKRTLTGVVMTHLNVVLLMTTVYYRDRKNANAIAAANHGRWNDAARSLHAHYKTFSSATDAPLCPAS